MKTVGTQINCGNGSTGPVLRRNDSAPCIVDDSGCNVLIIDEEYIHIYYSSLPT
jgi:hypothetical protein